jgi:hypothetical protein
MWRNSITKVSYARSISLLDSTHSVKGRMPRVAKRRTRRPTLRHHGTCELIPEALEPFNRVHVGIPTHIYFCGVVNALVLVAHAKQVLRRQGEEFGVREYFSNHPYIIYLGE